MRNYKTYYDLKHINQQYESTFNLPEKCRVKSNVLEYKKDYDGLHPTQKPIFSFRRFT